MTAVAQTHWLTKAREDLWKLFQDTKAPVKTIETWRRLPFDHWHIDNLKQEDASQLAGFESGRVGDGVVLCSLEEAARGYESFIKPFLAAPYASQDFRKLELANLACWRGGVFIHIPKGVTVKDPIHLIFKHDDSKPFQFPRSLVFVDDGADVSIVEEHVSNSSGKPVAVPTSVSFSKVQVGRNAKLRYFTNQELSSKSVHFSHQRIELARDASLEHYSIVLGAHRHKSELQVILGGPGASSEIRGVLLGKGDQFFDPHTQQHHTAGHTSSNLLFRAALRDRSRSIYTGLIRIEKDAPGCEAYQTNRNLLISEDARADSTPVLEIFPNEVSCKHGATAGPLDPEELFYLMSRGLNKDEALRMLILGFFDPILSVFPIETLKNRLTEKVSKEIF